MLDRCLITTTVDRDVARQNDRDKGRKTERETKMQNDREKDR